MFFFFVVVFAGLGGQWVGGRSWFFFFFFVWFSFILFGYYLCVCVGGFAVYHGLMMAATADSISSIFFLVIFCWDFFRELHLGYGIGGIGERVNTFCYIHTYPLPPVFFLVFGKIS